MMQFLPRYRATPALKETIRAQGRSVTWLARQIGVSRQYTSDAVHGKFAVRAEIAERVGAALGVPFFLLFELRDRNSGQQPRNEENAA